MVDSIDLVCKDEPEFQMWTSTLETLRVGKTDLTQYLLAIQKRQMEQEKKGETVESGQRRTQHQMLKTSKGAFNETEADVYSWGWGQ